MQVPPLHVSDCVHALPSLHAAVLFVCAQLPATQVSSVHGLASSHCAAVVHATQPGITVPAQVPPVHTSVDVHVFPSLHAVPFVACGFEHVPLAGLHVPATWH